MTIYWQWCGEMELRRTAKTGHGVADRVQEGKQKSLVFLLLAWLRATNGGRADSCTWQAACRYVVE